MRFSLLAALALLLCSCDAGPEPPPPPSRSSVSVSGERTVAFGAEADYKMGPTLESSFLQLLFPYPTTAIYSTDFGLRIRSGSGGGGNVSFGRQRELRPEVGRYEIVHALVSPFYPSTRFYASVVLDSTGAAPAERGGVYFGQSGYIEITRSDPGVIEGTFAFEAGSGDPREAAAVSVQGTFYAEGEDVAPETP